MEFFKKIFLTGAILMLGACSSTKMKYAESIEMDAYHAPNSQGANRHLPENSTGSRLRGGVIGGFTDRVKLDAVHNTGDRDTLDVDARYKIKYLPIYGSIDKFVKGKLNHTNSAINNFLTSGNDSCRLLTTKHYSCNFRSICKIIDTSLNHLKTSHLKSFVEFRCKNLVNLVATIAKSYLL